MDNPNLYNYLRKHVLFRYLYDELKNTAEDLNTHDQQLMDEDNALDEELRHLNKVCITRHFIAIFYLLFILKDT